MALHISLPRTRVSGKVSTIIGTGNHIPIELEIFVRYGTIATFRGYRVLSEIVRYMTTIYIYYKST